MGRLVHSKKGRKGGSSLHVPWEGHRRPAPPGLPSHQAHPGLCLEGCLWESCYPWGRGRREPRGVLPTTSPWPSAFPCRHLPPPSAKEAAKQSRSTGVGRSDFNSNTRSATHLPCNPGQATFVSLSFLTWRMAIIPSEGGQEDARRRKVC